MKKWTLHQQILRNQPTDRMRDLHMLHHTQSVPMLDETSVLHGNMPQRNDEEGGKQPRLSFSPAAQCGARWAAHGRQAAAVHRTPLRQSRRGTMLPSSISSSGSPTTLPSLLSRMCLAAARGTSTISIINN